MRKSKETNQVVILTDELEDQILNEGMQVANVIMMWMFSLTLLLALIFNIPLVMIFIVFIFGSFLAIYEWIRDDI